MKVIKIGAMWCPGCIVMHKLCDKLNKEYPNIEVKSLDLDMDEEEVKKYNIGDILPVTIFYKDDTELERLIGEKKFEDIESVIKKYE